MIIIRLRYFTYEIGEHQGEPFYALCEWTSEWKHLLLKINFECSDDMFKEEITRINIAMEYEEVLENMRKFEAKLSL